MHGIFSKDAGFRNSYPGVGISMDGRSRFQYKDRYPPMSRDSALGSR